MLMQYRFFSNSISTLIDESHGLNSVKKSKSKSFGSHSANKLNPFVMSFLPRVFLSSNLSAIFASS